MEKLDAILTARGDGLWGFEEGDQIHVTGFMNDPFGACEEEGEPGERCARVYYEVVQGDPHCLPYTDTGIMEQLRELLNEPKADWTEQGMQSLDYMYIHLDGMW